jgi:hypothetical protein
MSSSVAPLFPKTSIFIPAFWSASRGGLLTQEEADTLYLKFPVGQGTESIPNLIVSGSSTLGSVSASTLSQSGTYTNTNSGTPAKQVIIDNATPSITITDGTNTTLITPTSLGTTNTLQQVLDAGNSATGANAKISLSSSSIGYFSVPELTLNNTNATAGNTTGVPLMLFSKTGRNVVQNDIIGSQSYFARNYLGTLTEFGRIECVVTNSSAGASDDGALDFYTCVNGVSSLVMRLNGADNENNSFRPLDMNGNAIKSSTAGTPVSIQPTASTGLNITSTTGTNQATQYVKINAYDSIYSNSVKLTATDGSNFINSIDLNNNSNFPYLSISRDFGGAIKKNITMGCNTAGAGQNQLYAYDGQNNLPFLIQSDGVNNGSIELKTLDATGDLIFTGTNLESGSAGGNSGQHLRIKLNGTYYKIQLLND